MSKEFRDYVFETEVQERIAKEVDLIPLDGNVIPQSWYHEICIAGRKGKSNLSAITLLSEIVNCCRPTIYNIYGNGDGCKMYEPDALQKSYSEFMTKFGMTEHQVREGLSALSNLGIITVEHRNGVRYENIYGRERKANNVTYLHLHLDTLRRITYYVFNP